MMQTEAFALAPRVNAAGYHSQGPKTILLEGIPEGSGGKFYLFDPEKIGPVPFMKGKNVYTFDQIKIYPASAGDAENKPTGPQVQVWALDFTDFRHPGSYELRQEGDLTIKTTVKISDFTFWDTLKLAMKSFYFQRCGQEVLDSVTNQPLHADCHDHDGVIKPYRADAATLKIPPRRGTGGDVLEELIPKDTTGGWHDGSEYNKYLTSTGLALAHLMALYEVQTAPLNTLTLDYPVTEPGLGQLPDYLHEMTAGLDWMLSMQRLDGAFYRKVASKTSVGNIRPEADTGQRLIYGITTQDTAVGAASLAMAARIYKKKDLGYAVKCLMAAEKAWSFLNRYPAAIAQVFPEDAKGSNDYLQKPVQDMPYRLWAASELYLSTRKPQYLRYLAAHYPAISIEPITWRNPALQGLLDYYLHAGEGAEPAIIEFTKEHLRTLADDALVKTNQSAFHGWASMTDATLSEDILTRTLLLLNAYQVFPEKTEYRDAAIENLNFLMGQNPKDQVLVTGLAPNSVQTLDHRLSIALKKTLPGLVADFYEPDVQKAPSMQVGSPKTTMTPLAVYPTQHILNNALLIRVLGLCNADFNTTSKN